jgi:release factor glutamine methyltransferase
VTSSVATSAGERLTTAAAGLEAAGIATARIEAEWLLAEILGIGRFDVYLSLDRELDEHQARAFDAAVRRRAAGEPLQQILGWESFRGLRIGLTRDVLVPRPETETLVEHALALLPSGPRRVIDVGTGAGCIAAAIADARRDVCVVALDVSEAAARVARDNARRLGLSVQVVVGDLLSGVGGAVDLVVANPPYLPARDWPTLPREVRDWEPRIALDGGADGTALLRRIVADAPRVLAPGGALIVETGGESHVDGIARAFEVSGFVDTAIAADLTGRRRFVRGRRRAG